MAEPRVLLIAGAEEAALVRAALDGAQVALIAIEEASALETELAAGVDAVIVGAEHPSLDLDAAQVAWRKRGLAPPVIAFARTWSDAAMKASMARGVEDFVDGEHAARLAPALARELRRARVLQATTTSPAAHGGAHLLQAIIDALPFVLFVKDGEELRLQVVNEFLAKISGFEKSWLLGKLDHEYFPPDQAESVMAIDREVLATRQMKVFEEVARLDGVDVTVQTRKLPIVDAEGRLYVMGIAEDISDRRRAEAATRTSQEELQAANLRLSENVAELKRSRAISARTLASYQQRALQMEIIRQQNEDLDRLAHDLAKAKNLEEARAREIEQAARLKSEFLANFSHEIRTPLNGIIGYCDLLMREEGSRLTPHGRRDLSVVKANARTLLALINDILDLSKIEAGTVEVVKEQLDLPALVDECIATVREYLAGKAVEVYATIAPDVRSVRSDGLKLKQILLNLLSNAAKFTDAGEIAVEAKREGDELVVTVEDTGKGIPADQLQFIFEKFRQVDGSSTRKIGGTGLGLAIVRELSRVLGGGVTVTSTLGRGSLFTVRLPSTAEPTTDATLVESMTITERQEKPTGATVLVVDDDPLVHQLFKVELEKEGIRVLLARDGVEALAMARQHRPAAIVLDLHLPKLDGWTVMAEIKANPALANIPIVIVSIEEQRARGFSLGACEYLVKPVDPERLVAVVSKSIAPGGGEVLVVDDDTQTRELVARQLKRAGFTVAEARDGGEALLRARVTRPGLMVLDLMMPEPNGFEVLRQLRAESIDVPVVVLTGKTLSDEEQRNLREGMAAVVQKGGSAIESIIAEARRLVVDQRRTARAQLPRVLYVEDSAQNRDVVRRYLNGVFDVLEAEDGEHGLDRAQREVPDLILMDLSLPRVDGWEATRRLKAGPLASIPVVALTAHASREDQARARAAGCDGYLTKPVDRDLLIETIRKHLARRSPTPPPVGPRDGGTITAETSRSG